MFKHTSVTLGDHFQQFVDTRVENERYGPASEVMRTALRIMEREEREEEAKMEALRVSIEKGMKSGRADYSLDKLTERLGSFRMRTWKP